MSNHCCDLTGPSLSLQSTVSKQCVCFLLPFRCLLCERIPSSLLRLSFLTCSYLLGSCSCITLFSLPLVLQSNTYTHTVHRHTFWLRMTGPFQLISSLFDIHRQTDRPEIRWSSSGSWIPSNYCCFFDSPHALTSTTTTTAKSSQYLPSLLVRRLRETKCRITQNVKQNTVNNIHSSQPSSTTHHYTSCTLVSRSFLSSFFQHQVWQLIWLYCVWLRYNNLDRDQDLGSRKSLPQVPGCHTSHIQRLCNKKKVLWLLLLPELKG